jgi:hypothetical protein
MIGRKSEVRSRKCLFLLTSDFELRASVYPIPYLHKIFTIFVVNGFRFLNLPALKIINVTSKYLHL